MPLGGVRPDRQQTGFVSQRLPQCANLNDAHTALRLGSSIPTQQAVRPPAGSMSGAPPMEWSGIHWMDVPLLRTLDAWL